MIVNLWRFPLLFYRVASLVVFFLLLCLRLSRCASRGIVLGTITDAQESELQAVEELWPNVPHQVCQFHVLREASRPAFEADRKIKTAMRKQMQPKVRELRKQLQRAIPQAPPAEAEQLSVLDDYALGVLTALNRDGTLPFEYPAVRASEDLDEVEASLEHLEKKGER